MLRRSVWVVSILVASMLGAIFGPALASAVVPGSVSGDEALVYVPVEPCKVFAGIDLDGADLNDVATLDMTAVGMPSGQGGEVCAQTAVPAEAVAVSLNLIAQFVDARGNLQIGPAGGNTESVVNFVDTVDMNNSTELTVPVNGNGEIDVRVGGSGTNGIANVATAKGVLLGYWVPGDSVYESFERTVVVSGAGTDAENGAALLAAVSAVNAQSPTGANPWLIKLEPGVFNVGASSAVLSNGMNLEGAGIGVSQIVGTNPLLVDVNSNSTTVSELTTRSTNVGFAVGLNFVGVGRVHNVHALGGQSAVDFTASADGIVADGLIAETLVANSDLDVLTSDGVGDILVMNSTILGTETTDVVVRVTGAGTFTLVNTFIEDTTNAASASVVCRAITNPTTFLPTTCS